MNVMRGMSRSLAKLAQEHGIPRPNLQPWVPRLAGSYTSFGIGLSSRLYPHDRRP